VTQHKVVLAADNHPDYSFLLPITAILWAKMTMYKPIVIWSKLNYCLNLLGDSGAIGLHCGTFQNDRMHVKLSRWHDISYQCEDDDMLLLQDVDTWPIDGTFWNREATKSVTCFYGDVFDGKAHTTQGFRATAKFFREVFPGTSRERLEQIRAEHPEGYYSDDAAQSPRVLRWMEDHPKDYVLVQRGPSPPADRIDRSAWPQGWTPETIKGKVDAHLPRDASDGRVWKQILPLFDLLAPDWSGWVRAYRSAWERM